MKRNIFCFIVFTFLLVGLWSPNVEAARCAVSSSLYSLSNASALSPYQLGIMVKRKDGADTDLANINVSGPIVNSLVFEVIDEGNVTTSTSSKKGREGVSTSVTLLHKMQYGVDLVATSGSYVQRFFSRNQADGSGLNYDHHDFKEQKIIQSSVFAGKLIKLRMSEVYNCGKTIVASEAVVQMPSGMVSAVESSIMADTRLQVFITSAVQSNNWTMTTYPGSFVKSNIGVKHAELYINGNLYDVASYGQNLSGESMKLGDGSSFHMYEASKGAPYVFKRYSNTALLPPSTTEARIRVVDLAGNVSEKVFIY